VNHSWKVSLVGYLGKRENQLADGNEAFMANQLTAARRTSKAASAKLALQKLDTIKSAYYFFQPITAQSIWSEL